MSRIYSNQFGLYPYRSTCISS